MHRVLTSLDLELLPSGCTCWPPEPIETAPGGAPLPVSVVIPAFQREEFVEMAVLSALAQVPRPPAEVIVVDDGSTDETAIRAERLGALVLRQQANRGAATARHRGLLEARQPWVAFLDSDDEWLPYHLAALWEMRHGHVLVAGTSIEHRDDGRGRILGWPGRGPVVLRSPKALVYPQNFLHLSTALIDRDALLRSGGAEGPHRLSEDFDMVLRVLAEGSALIVPTVVSRYRLHHGQKSRDVTGARRAQHAIVLAQRARWRWIPAQLDRRRAVEAWDDLRAALRQGDRRGALWPLILLVSSPRRATALIGLLAWRASQRRASARVAGDGGPTLALLPGARLHQDVEESRVIDLRRCGTARALLFLSRRPTGAAVTSGRIQPRVLRLLRIPPFRSAHGA